MRTTFVKYSCVASYTYIFIIQHIHIKTWPLWNKTFWEGGEWGNYQILVLTPILQPGCFPLPIFNWWVGPCPRLWGTLTPGTDSQGRGGLGFPSRKRGREHPHDSWLPHPPLLGYWAWLGLTVLWESHKLWGLAGKADTPGVTGADSELIRTPRTEVFDDEVSVQGRSYRLLPGLGT